MLYSAKPTKITKVDLKIEANREDHHTSEYAHKGLILRRGQTFELEIEVNNPWNKSDDQLRLQYAMGENSDLIC